MASASGYNHHRFSRAVLKKSRKWEPSLTLEFHTNNWKFEHSAMIFTYDGPMRPFLLALRSQTIPPALMPFLYDIQPPVSFVDGCIVVEIHDLRRNPETRTRVVMRPAPLAISQTIDQLLERNGVSVEDEHLSLAIEARILSGTSAPLYIGTSILATRNAVLALGLTAPIPPNLSANGQPRSTTTSSSSTSSDFERMRRLLKAGDTSRSSASGGMGMGVPFQPKWSVLNAKARAEEIEKEKKREIQENQAREAAAAEVAARGGYQGMMGDGSGGPGGAGGGGAGHGPGTVEKKKTKKKRPAEDDTGAGGEVKKTKKKKTAAAAAGEGDKKVKIEPAGGGGGGAGGAGGMAMVTPEKPKKTKKKKAAPAE